jgi:hypothetical protein
MTGVIVIAMRFIVEATAGAAFLLSFALPRDAQCPHPRPSPRGRGKIRDVENCHSPTQDSPGDRPGKEAAAGLGHRKAAIASKPCAYFTLRASWISTNNGIAIMAAP